MSRPRHPNCAAVDWFPAPGTRARRMRPDAAASVLELLIAEAQEVRYLRLPEDLGPVISEAVGVAGQSQPGTMHETVDQRLIIADTIEQREEFEKFPFLFN